MKHEHQVIAHSGTNRFIGVEGNDPKEGTKVQFFQIGGGKSLSVFWKFQDIPGGQRIVLESNTNLALSLESEPTNGVALQLAKVKDGDKKQIWSKANLPAIISLSGKLLVLDSDGPNGLPQVWYPLQNDHQQWQIDTLTSDDADGQSGKYLLQ